MSKVRWIGDDAEAWGEDRIVGTIPAVTVDTVVKVLRERGYLGDGVYRCVIAARGLVVSDGDDWLYAIE